MPKNNRLISFSTALLVAFLAAGAFWLSFDALRDLAAAHGIAAGRAWLYPAIIDGAIIVFSLSVLQAGLNRQATRYPWFLVGLFTVLSIALNIVHAPASFLARLLAAVPPLALFLSFELLMSQVKGLVEHAAAVQSLQRLTAMMREKRAEMDGLVKERAAEAQKLSAQLERMASTKESLQAELTELRREKRAFRSRIEQINQTRSTAKEEALEKLLTYLSENPDATFSEMAAAIERSKTTASNYVSELQDAGRLHKNGHGWEIPTT